MNKIQIMSQIQCKMPWPKIQFKTETDHIYDGYIWSISGDSFYISQNQSYETMGLAQNWIIKQNNIIKFYDEKYGLRCTCGMIENTDHHTHLLNCKWNTINTDLL